jgi:tripartite-type tricarboxylate transporter receptor subunit TctC
MPKPIQARSIWGRGVTEVRQHLYGELFKMMAGIDMVHVPYRGQPLSDLIAGHVQVVFNPMPSTIEFIRAGRLRALAVTTARRQETVPDTPSVAEFLPGYEASGWFGLGAPKKTPGQIIEILNKEINAALADLKVRFANLGAEPMPMTAAEFSELIADETTKWGKVVRAAGINLD